MLKMTFKQADGNKRSRWILTDSDGTVVAKFYVKPIGDTVNALLENIDSAAVGYRARVNSRCDAKGIARLY